jgi:hypothetical protein
LRFFAPRITRQHRDIPLCSIYDIIVHDTD